VVSYYRVENANGRVVSFRQKARGMSWSREGSTGLASVSAAIINGELLKLVTTHYNLTLLTILLKMM